MRTIPPALQARMDAGVTTLCTVWIVQRADGVGLGFTDHDGPLTVEGVSCSPVAGFTPGDIDQGSSLDIDNTEVMGALSADRISADDLESGLYDDAAVRVFRVDWQAPEDRFLLFTAHIGEVTRAGGSFRAELRGPTDRLDRRTGRQFQRTCDAVFGDARCGVNLATAAFTGTGVVASQNDPLTFTCTGLSGFAAGWFERGRITVSSGAAAGRTGDVVLHQVQGGAVRLELADALALAVGDAFTVTAGCDKTPETCRAKFANMAAFRGFPHMPGNDWVSSYPVRGSQNDGGRLLDPGS